MIRALCREPFEIRGISDSDDTRIMKEILDSRPAIMNAGHAGTAFRFLTAWLSLQEGSTILTGSDRMKERPVKDLVDALKSLGANIKYLEKEGYPPLEIGAPAGIWQNEITIASDTSSQYISALMMVAPVLPEGLTITLQGKVVSRPYILMTARMMQYFGAEVSVNDSTIRIAGKPYVARNIDIEADWSSASYFYIMAALSESTDLQIMGLQADSMQGDAKIAELCSRFGVHTEFTERGVRITKNSGTAYPEFIEQDFTNTPDLAQGVAVLCAGLNIKALFSGLETLYIKETDRVKALQSELSKVGVQFYAMPARFSPKKGVPYYMLESADENVPKNVAFETYGDHRMAMAFACLGLKQPVTIKNADVVTKSYPAFWSDLQKIGFQLTLESL